MTLSSKERRQRHYAKLRADPERWAAFLAKKREEQKRRRVERGDVVRAKDRRNQRARRRDPERVDSLRARERDLARSYRAKDPQRYSETWKRYRARKKALAKTKAHAAAHQNKLYAAAIASVPRTYPPDVRDDIVAAVMLAVLEGQITQGEIAKRAKEYATKHYRQFDQFKNVSLDATVPGTESLRLIDTIAADAPHF